MQSDEVPNDSVSVPGGEHTGGRRVPISRRQAIGRMSVVATAGAAAWVVPEILTARPAAGATLSGETGGTTWQADDPASSVTTTAAVKTDPSLAFTGLNLERDAQVGAALIAGGWAMHHWASARPDEAKPQVPPPDSA